MVKKPVLATLLPSLALSAILLATAPVRAESEIAAVVTSNYLTNAIAVNPVTNKIYAVDPNAIIAVMDGDTNTVTMVQTPYPATGPYDVAVNSATNKIYVTNVFAGHLAVLDGATNTTSRINGVIYGANCVVVNPVTNKIYLGNGGNTINVIDGATNLVSTITIATNNGLGGSSAQYVPHYMAVNQTTNKIYVVNSGSNTVTVIDGVTNSTTTVAIGTSTASSPAFIAINPATNKIYVAGPSNIVSVINGANNKVSTVTLPGGAVAIALNPVTNKVYVTTQQPAITPPNSITVIDGATNSTNTFVLPSVGMRIVVNPVTNRIYVTRNGAMTVMDGATNSTSVITPLSTSSLVAAVNPATNRIYTGGQSNVISVIAGAAGYNFCGFPTP